MRLGRTAASLALVAACTRLLGCGSSVSAAHYGQGCVHASDCIAVGVGDPCSTECSDFPSVDAIARSAQPTYSYDAIEARYGCRGCSTLPTSCINGAAKLSATKSAYCSAGVCTVCNSTNACDCAPKDPTCNGVAPVPDAGVVDSGPPVEASPVDTGSGDDGSTEASSGDAGDGGDGAPASDGGAEASPRDAQGEGG